MRPPAPAMTSFTVREKHRNAAVLDLAAVGALPHEDVIPAFLVKDIADQGRAQDESHLIAGQSGLELRHHFLGDVIPLLDFHPVGCEARRKLARRSEKRQRQNQDSRHDQDVSAAMKRYMIAETGIFPRGDPP